MADIRILLNSDTKKRFKSYCAENGITMTEAILKAINKYIDK